MSHFWVGGASEYAKALEAEYAGRRAELERQLAAAREAGERDSCRQTLQALRAEYQANQRAIGRSLF